MSDNQLLAKRKYFSFRPKKLLTREYIAFYLFASPWLLGLLIFVLGPTLASLGLSFTEYPVIVPPKFIGIGNFVTMAKDPLVLQALKVTSLYSFGAVPLGLVASFLIALLMNQGIRAIRLWRTVYYLPSVISGVPVSLVWMWVLNPDFGILNNALRALGIQNPPKWLFSREWVIPAFIIMSLWNVGSAMVIFLAGLQGIPVHLYEAAEIDGATSIDKFFNVTIPMMSPVILFNLVMGVIGSFQTFTPAFIMTQGGPANGSLFYGLYLYNNAFRWFNMGYASALAWLMFLIILLMTMLVFRATNRWVYYGGSISE